MADHQGRFFDRGGWLSLLLFATDWTKKVFARSSGHCARPHQTPRHPDFPHVHLIFSSLTRHANLAWNTRSLLAAFSSNLHSQMAELQSGSARPKHNKGKAMRTRWTDYLSTSWRAQVPIGQITPCSKYPNHLVARLNVSRTIRFEQDTGKPCR